MTNLIIQSPTWNFLVVPRDLEDDFLKEVMKSYCDFATYKDSSGNTHLPIYDDVANDTCYAKVIESYYHCLDKNIPFNKGFYEDNILVRFSDYERDREEEYLQRAYDHDLFIDTKKVLDTLHLTYTDSWESRYNSDMLLSIVEVW